MKKVPVMLAIGFAMILSRGLGEVAARDRKDNNGIPQSALAGNFATVMHGTFGLCLDPTSNFAEISCTHPKAEVFPQTDVEIGHSTSIQRETGVTRRRTPFPISR